MKQRAGISRGELEEEEARGVGWRRAGGNVEESSDVSCRSSLSSGSLEVFLPSFYYFLADQDDDDALGASWGRSKR